MKMLEANSLLTQEAIQLTVSAYMRYYHENNTNISLESFVQIKEDVIGGYRN